MSASGVFGPAPPGIDLTETQNHSITTAVISLMIIGTFFVFLRIIARTCHRENLLAVDDYCIMLGLVSSAYTFFNLQILTAILLFAHGTASCTLVSLPYGGGKHLWVLTGAEFTKIWQILFAYVMIYAFAVTFTKLSIVLFYRRIFGMNWGLWACIFFIISYWVTVCVTIVVSCSPLDFFWTRYTTKDAVGHCINVPLFFLANGIWAMLVDVCILVIPIPIVLKLQIPLQQKRLVLLIFLLGGFVCIASVVRIVTIHTVITSDDLTWAMGQLFIWSCCEPFIGIVCACLPTLAPLFRHWWTTVRTRQDSSSAPASANVELSNTSRNVKARSAPYKKPTLHSSSASNSSTVQLDSRIPKTKKWSRLQGDSDLKLRDDEQMEFSTDITGPGGSLRTKDSDEEIGRCVKGDIRVKTDVRWSEAQVDGNQR